MSSSSKKNSIFSKKNLLFICSIFLLFLSACENDMKVINSLVADKKLPEMSAKDVEMIISDSGNVIAYMTTKQLDRYNFERPYIEMPKGVKVLFYDSLKRVNASLSASYAINYENEKVMDVRSNVIVVNVKGQVLNTEHLVWNQKTKRIYSDVFVKVTTQDEIIKGTGLDADEQFDKWKITHVTGTIMVKNDKEGENDSTNTK
ncbi:MAG: LPS export ABC transporter periplasmic protein LptC [Bacteroidetes bacterium]|nr:LPS export ABC transporter periplasmic protein LptC [Bacteroidota bacterium]